MQGEGQPPPLRPAGSLAVLWRWQRSREGWRLIGLAGKPAEGTMWLWHQVPV